jgi:hypothetical protein
LQGKERTWDEYVIGMRKEKKWEEMKVLRNGGDGSVLTGRKGMILE